MGIIIICFHSVCLSVFFIYKYVYLCIWFVCLFVCLYYMYICMVCMYMMCVCYLLRFVEGNRERMTRFCESRVLLLLLNTNIEVGFVFVQRKRGKEEEGVIAMTGFVSDATTLRMMILWANGWNVWVRWNVLLKREQRPECKGREKSRIFVGD